MSTHPEVLQRRAELRRCGTVPADPDLPRAFDFRVREGATVAIEGPGGKVATLEFRTVPGRPDLHLVLRYRDGDKAIGQKPRRDWKATVIDNRGKRA